jgi:methionyl-tRNA synthetase
LARFYRFAGIDTFLLTGTAEHGQKMEEAAKKAGEQPEKFTREMSAKFSQTWDSLGIAPDDFIRTNEQRHINAVEAFFQKLKESGQIYEGEYEGLYCVGHEAFIKESDLDDTGLCPEHKTKPEKIKEQNWFFKLSEYGELVAGRIRSGEFVVEPESRRNEVLKFIEQGLDDISISRQDVTWAIPLPWDKSQTIYVWLDELFNYCSAIGYEDDKDKFDRLWPADLHLIGKDIIKFHCIIWPALLTAVGLPWPKKVFAHGFFTINGQKMSKTLQNVVDPNKLVRDYGADAIRYFLLREIPFGQDGDFSVDKFKARYEADLANGLGNLLSRLANLIERYSDGQIPELFDPPRDLDKADKLLLELKFHEALGFIWEEIAWANKLIDESKLWELPERDPKKFFEYISTLSAHLYEIAKKLSPFMPETSESIRSALSADRIKKPEPLFPRLD